MFDEMDRDENFFKLKISQKLSRIFGPFLFKKLLNIRFFEHLMGATFSPNISKFKLLSNLFLD